MTKVINEVILLLYTIRVIYDAYVNVNPFFNDDMIFKHCYMLHLLLLAAVDHLMSRSCISQSKL
jgi:hypothetical protein